MRSFLHGVAIIAIAALALKLLVVLLEPRLAFFPVRGLTHDPSILGISHQEIILTTRDGESICVWALFHPNPRAEILFFHGNGGNLGLWLEFLAEVHQQGYSVFALDYRGYGKSTGTPTEEGLYQDVEAFVTHFQKQLHQPPRRVIYWGRSLGGWTSAYAATLHEPDGLILEATFPSKWAVIRHYLLYRLLGVFSRYEFPTLKFARQVSCPVLVIHGDRDPVIPFEVGQQLFDQLPGEKYFYTVPGAYHNDQHQVDPRNYWLRLTEFIDRTGNG